MLTCLYDDCMTDQNDSSDKPSDLGILYVRLAPGLKTRVTRCAEREQRTLVDVVGSIIQETLTPTGRRRRSGGNG